MAGDTGAVKVTAWPVTDGFTEDARLTAAAALATVTDTAPDVLARVIIAGVRRGDGVRADCKVADDQRGRAAA